jgi:predicted ArsR family transcriptional regulator
MAQALDITVMAVRKHLNVLERESYIYAFEMKQPIGRPVLVYALTPQADELFPKSYK